MTDFVPGYSLAPQQIATIRVLEWLYDNTGSDHRVLTDLNGLREPLGVDADNAALISWISFLRGRGWLDEMAATLSLGSARLTPAGIHEVESLRHERQERKKARMGAANALLRWLPSDADRFPDQPAYPSHVRDFLDSDAGLFYGAPYQEVDVLSAANWLAERGLVKPLMIAGQPHRVRITPEGEDVVDDGLPVQDWNRQRRAQGHHGGGNGFVTVNGDNNVIAANHSSPGAAQSISVHRTQEAKLARDVADALSGLANALGLNSAQQAMAEELVSELREVAQAPAPETRRLRALLGKVADLVVKGAAPQMAQGILWTIEHGGHELAELTDQAIRH